MRAASAIVLTLLSTAVAAQAVADPEPLQQVIEDVQQPYEGSTVDVDVVEGLPDIPEVEAMMGYTVDRYTVPAMDLGRWDPSMVDPESHRLVHEALVLLRSLEPPEAKANLSSDKGKEKDGGLLSRWSRRAKSALDALRILKVKSLETTEQKIQNDPLVQATLKLETAAAKSNPDALWLLADLNFHGNFSHPLNYAQASHYYSLLASATGNASAQFLLGFLHATALGSGSSPDHAKALTYYTFAAQANETRAQRALAYRYHMGLGTPKNCEEAMEWYRRVAVTSREYYRGGPPGGRHVKRESYRIADDEGGVYGHGASASSSGPGYLGSYRRNVINTNARDGSFEDVFEYLQYVASKGDASAQSILGVLYYDGSRTQERNFGEAMYWFRMLAKQVWLSGIAPGRAIHSPTSDITSLAAKAAGYIGRMYLRGEGVEQDLWKAFDWFRRGVSMGDAMSQNGVGHMFLNGLATKKDVDKAREYFKASAEQGFAPAQVNFAKLLLASPQPSSLSAASQWLELAASEGHVEAYWLLGEMWANGVGRSRSCDRAVGYYKAVAERVEEVGPSGFEDGNRALQRGDLAGAIVYYMMAAEQGYEVGQANAAFLLDGDKTMLDPKAFLKTRSLAKVPKHPRLEKLALTYFSQSAHQSNVDSMIKMGDYFLHGFGLSHNTTDAKKAAQCYHAAERFHSAMAMWNLGWMHENGIGVEQDFHLAKRYYDQAALSSREAYAPVMMSLLKLRVRSVWNALTGGTINGIQKGPAPTMDTSWRSWLAKWYEHQPAAAAAAYRDREDDYDYTIYGDEYDDFGYGEDDLMESLVILTLCAVVGLFLWWRQRRVLRQRNGQQGGQQQGMPVQGAVGLGRPDWVVPH